MAWIFHVKLCTLLEAYFYQRKMATSLWSLKPNYKAVIANSHMLNQYHTDKYVLIPGGI